jgi:DNA-binding PadR family transcriptional regulator
MGDHLGEFEQVLLFGLVRLGEDAHGAGLGREIERQTGRSVSPGAIRTAMSRLETRGFVSSRLGEPTARRGGRRKRLYRLEPRGARALTESYERVRRMAEDVVGRLAELTEEGS